MIKEYESSLKWQDIKDSPPMSVEIETISTCNRKCDYCPVSKLAGRKTKLPEDIFFSLIDNLFEMGFIGQIGTAMLCEPLLDSRTIKLFAYVRKVMPYVKTHLVTNGDLLTYDKCKELLDNSFTSIRITEHDDEYDKYDEIAAFVNDYPQSLLSQR